MDHFYPGKLSWSDAVRIRGSHTSVGLKVVEELMRLDYRAPVASSNNQAQVPTCSSLANLDRAGRFKNFRILSNRPPAVNTADCVHPMDVMNVIYNCCDNIVLQTLVEKLFLCRLGIPLLFPDSRSRQSTFLLWSLRGIVPEPKSGDVPRSGASLVDIEQSIVAFLRLGRLHVSKSKLINELLSSGQPDTFFHRDCVNGMSARMDCGGTVEASWFIPSDNGTFGFHETFAILNLRGEATMHESQAEWLCSVSNLVVIMIDAKCVGKDNSREFIKTIGVLKTNLVLCIVSDNVILDPNFETDLGHLLDNISNGDMLLGIVYNWNDYRLLGAGELKTEIQSVVGKFLEVNVDSKTTINRMASTIRGRTGFRVDEDDLLCRAACEKARRLMESIEHVDPRTRRGELLLLQDAPWKKLTRIRKEQRRMCVSVRSVEQFIADKDSEEASVRQNQLDLLENRLPQFVRQFCSELQMNDDSGPYFIEWMKLLLGGSSRTDGSSGFGLEHIFREFGQMYEVCELYRNSSALSTSPDIIAMKQCISKLPSIVAGLMLQGMPVELLDGDAAFVPIDWVKSVFEQLKIIVGDKKLFIISIVGIQSSGKSTLLNTMFGLKFAVSVGRCSRGLLCQLIPVDKDSMAVEFDYVLVIDTEGLRPPDLQYGNRIFPHDNELATFIIGLADVTIVNVKGEHNTEVSDILQIVIHAMIRIKLVRSGNLPKPSCVFVHQNVSAINAEGTLSVERQKFRSKLDLLTAAAAESENQLHIQCLNDIIDYDEQRYAFYMPDLWQGQPPMASVNCGYSEKAGKLKDLLLRIIGSRSKPASIGQLITKISDLWNATLSEDFVFSFRNSEEIKAYLHLDSKFAKLLMTFKDASFKLQDHCQQVINGMRDAQNLTEDKVILQGYVSERLLDQCRSLQEELTNYFDERKDDGIVEQWRGRYQNNLDKLCQDELERQNILLTRIVDSKLGQLKTTCEVDLYCREKIASIAMEEADKLKDSNRELDKITLSKHFHQEWPKWLRKYESTDHDENWTKIILNFFKTELVNHFSSHRTLLLEELRENSFEILTGYKFDSYEPVICGDDLTFSRRSADEERICLNQAREKCNTILRNIESLVESYRGNDVCQGQAGIIVNKLKLLFDNIGRDVSEEKQKFVFKHKFQIRFTIHVSQCAANELVKIKLQFQKHYHPLAEIRGREDEFLQLFLDTYNDIAKDQRAAGWLSTEISNWVKTRVLTKLGWLIKDEVIADESHFFDSKQTFLRKILTEIAANNDFESYMDYIKMQEVYIRRQVKVYVDEIMNKKHAMYSEKTKFEVLIESEIRKHLSSIEASIGELLGLRFVNLEEFIAKLKTTFAKNRDGENSGPLYPPERLNVFEKMEFVDIDRFMKTLVDNLNRSSFHAELCEAVTSQYKVGTGFHLVESVSYDTVGLQNPVDLLCDIVSGCTERCPFCRAPCRYSTVDHGGGGRPHSASQHYPIGVIGAHWEDTKNLIVENCQSAVASDMRFKNGDTQHASIPYRNYKEYYGSWEIPPQRKAEVSLFWKWFLNKFHDDIVNRFQVKHGSIPTNWKNISWEDAMKSLSEPS